MTPVFEIVNQLSFSTVAYSSAILFLVFPLVAAKLLEEGE